MQKDLTITANRISDNFYCFEQSGVRSYLFIGEKEALAVDALNGGELLSHIRKLTDKPLKLILTHSDPDHTGCAFQFGSAFLHPAEFARLEARYSFPLNMYPVFEGDVIDIGTYCFEVILIPGHTPGSIALLEREKRFIIGGDTVQTGPVYMFGDGRSMKAYSCSLRHLKDYERDADFFYSSHHEFNVPFSTVDCLTEFSDRILAGDYPAPLAAPNFLPENIKIYSDGKVSFLLAKPE